MQIFRFRWAIIALRLRLFLRRISCVIRIQHTQTKKAPFSSDDCRCCRCDSVSFFCGKTMHLTTLLNCFNLDDTLDRQAVVLFPPGQAISFSNLTLSIYPTVWERLGCHNIHRHIHTHTGSKPSGPLGVRMSRGFWKQFSPTNRIDVSCGRDPSEPIVVLGW